MSHVQGIHHVRPGPQRVGVASFAVLPDALGFWVERLLRHGVDYEPPVRRAFGGAAESALAFRDPDGLRLEIVGHPGAEARSAWAGALGVAPEEAVLPPIRLPAPAGAAVMLGASAGPADAGGGALGFVHRYLPPSDGAERARSTTLLLLHGTGGDEENLLPLGRRLLPGAALLSPRGNVREGGMPRFFRRHAEGVFDQEDLARRTAELAEFVDRAAAAYAFDRGGVVAVGFSNGANIAASLLLRRGAVLRGAVLLSPMLPFEPEAVPDLTGAAVFIGAGRSDPLVPASHADRLALLLREAGAEVAVHWEPGGHQIAPGAVKAARAWLARLTGGHADGGGTT